MNAHVLLLTAFRAKEAMKQETQKQEAKQFVKDYEGFETKNPGKGIKEFLNGYSREFPTMEECYILNLSCIELAITYFCQVIKPGNKAEGLISGNTKAFIDTHLPYLKDIAFKSMGEKIIFDVTWEKLETVRDKMIGHADGEVHMIDYTGKRSSNSPKELWEKIPLELLCKMCKQLSHALDVYMLDYN